MLFQYLPNFKSGKYRDVNQTSAMDSDMKLIELLSFVKNTTDINRQLYNNIKIYVYLKMS